MKVNVVIPFTCLTGGIRVIFLYGNYLVSQGHEVKFYVPMKAYKFKLNTFGRIKFSLGNTIKRRTKVKWFDCKFKIKLVPWISDKYIKDADISIATAWPVAYDVNALSDSKGKKVYFIQGYEVWSGDEKEVENSYRLDLNRITITNELREKLKEKFNVDSKVIYNGMFENEYIQGKKVSNEKIRILMLYSPMENKGSKEGIQVLKKIKANNDVDVCLFGFKKEGDIPSDFTFYENPEREVLIDLYRKSDIYVFPSKEESWGLPVIEAMANKCAVVGNSVGALKEIGVNNVNSMIVKNYDDMEEKIVELINNRDKLKALQEEGYRTVQELNWNNSFREFEKYLENLL